MRTLGRRIVFRRRRNVRSKHSFAIFIYFVCFASQNAILSHGFAVPAPFKRGLWRDLHISHPRWNGRVRPPFQI